MEVSFKAGSYTGKMFVRMLTVHCDQNNGYEITINGLQVRKINEIRNVIKKKGIFRLFSDLSIELT